MNVVPPENYSTKSRRTVKRGRRYGKLSNKNFDRRVRQVILRHAEPKKKQSMGEEQLKTTIDVDPYIIDVPFDATQGDATYERIGNRITARGLSCKFLIHNTSTSTAAISYVRIAILEVKAGAAQTNAGLVVDLYDPLASGSDVTYSGGLGSLLRSFNKEQVRVLKDDVLLLNKGNADNPVIIYDKYFSLNEELIYSDSDQTQPWNKRYVALLLPLQIDSDEGMGTQIEVSHLLTAYYKDF